MANVIIVGAQWGDEGKGKVVDLYTEFADVVVRFGGGANAGHTLVVGDQKLITHLIPSGVLRGRGKRCVLAGGMVIDPKTLLEEIAELKSRGLLQDDKDLVISTAAHVILPEHREVDRLRELGKNAIGTTKRGIGPAYEAKMARRGVRMIDLIHPERLKELLLRSREELAQYIAERGGTFTPLEQELEESLAYGQKIKRYFTDTSSYVHQEMTRGRHVLFEGAQGALLDIDHGTYPFVTSSSTIAAGACTSCGIGPTSIDAVIGIAKAYTTRVGGGPFPTELGGENATVSDAALGEQLRKVGHEYGSTTGRPRRCGWLDVAALRLAARWNGMSGIALTKLDVLSKMKRVKICVGYKVNGREMSELPCDINEIEGAQPIYEELEGWDADTTSARDFESLPTAAQRYVRRIEALVGVDIGLISVGPARAETIMIKNPFR